MRIANCYLKFSAAKWINAELGPRIGFIKPLNPLNPNLTKVDPQFSLLVHELIYVLRTFR